MIRNYHNLACAVLGCVLMLLAERGLDLYIFLVLGLAIPWDKLAKMTGELAEEYMLRHRNQNGQEVREQALQQLESYDKQGEA